MKKVTRAMGLLGILMNALMSGGIFTGCGATKSGGGHAGTGGAVATGGASQESGGATGTGGNTASGGMIGSGGSGTGGTGMGGFTGSGGTAPGGTGTGGMIGGGGIGSGGTGTGGKSTAGSGTGGIGPGGTGGKDTSGMGTGGASATGGGPGSGGIGPAGGTGGTIPCPTSAPAVGEPCAGASGSCSWGTEPRLDCRVTGSCYNGAWSIRAPAAYCTAPVPAACPALSAAYGSCSDTSLSCLYEATTRCGCVPCNCNPGPPGPPCAQCQGNPMGTPVWFCDTPPVPLAPCPSYAPNAGSPCDTPGMACPGVACNQLIAKCTDGRWQWVTSTVCPACASPDTPIATPEGDRPIADLKAGDLVYSVEGDGIRAVPILRVGRTPVVNHRVVRVRLTGGRILEISAGHPTADGRTFAALTVGASLDGAVVELAETIPYTHPYTYDILPASASGDYFAAGLRIGSTLANKP